MKGMYLVISQPEGYSSTAWITHRLTDVREDADRYARIAALEYPARSIVVAQVRTRYRATGPVQATEYDL